MRTDSDAAPGPALYGPYIDAPVWPWSLAGWSLAVFFVLFTLAAWAAS